MSFDTHIQSRHLSSSYLYNNGTQLLCRSPSILLFWGTTARLRSPHSQNSDTDQSNFCQECRGGALNQPLIHRHHSQKCQLWSGKGSRWERVWNCEIWNATALTWMPHHGILLQDLQSGIRKIIVGFRIAWLRKWILAAIIVQPKISVISKV